MMSYFSITAMVFPNQLRVGSCCVSIGPIHWQSPYKRFKAWLAGSLRLGLFGCWRFSSCMQNDEITKLTSYMVGIPFPEGAQPMTNSIQLAACGANKHLPSCPDLPADIFTSCLTSLINVALRYFINNITADMVVQLLGDLKDRRTPLGELNWIFTAITDTIVWTTFSRETFTRLYRCGLLIASLFLNFLLAECIMRITTAPPHTLSLLSPPPTLIHCGLRGTWLWIHVCANSQSFSPSRSQAR